MSEFKGFSPAKENWSKLPHELIDALPEIETNGEMKVIIYTLRHTWGYQDEYKKITLDEFENGRKRKDGSRIDNGTGLTKPTIVDGIKRAIRHSFLFEHIDTSDSARVKKFYSLTEEGLKDLTPDVKRFNTGGKESLHRTEKETIKKETTESLANSQNSQPNGSSLVRSDQEERDNLNALCDSIAKVTGVNIATAHKTTIDELKRLALSFYGLDVRPDDLRKFNIWWYDYSWQGKKGQSPTLKQVGDSWGQFEAQKVAPPSNGPTLTDAEKKRLKELIAENG